LWAKEYRLIVFNALLLAAFLAILAIRRQPISPLLRIDSDDRAPASSASL
jgi:hypothetical protein